MVRSTWLVGVSSRLGAVPAPGLALATLMALNLMWGGSLPATKLALQSFGPFSLAAARLVLASALFLSLLGPRSVGQVPGGDALRMAGLGVIGFTAVQVFQALGTDQTTAATATVLASTAPLWIAMLAPVLLRERVRAATIVGLAQPEAPVATPLGGVIVLLSSAAAALYTVLGKGVAQRYSPLVLCTGSCLGGALASLPLAAWEVVTKPLSPAPLGWLLLAYLGVLVTFVGFAVWFWGLRALPAARAGALMFLQPLSGLVLASVVLGEQLTPTFLLGCGLVLVGVYLAVARP
jgi:drug/metabolite transporter (DMT)-like permease